MTQKEIGDLKREVSESSRSKYKHLEIAEMKTKRIAVQMYKDGSMFLTCLQFGDVMSIVPDDMSELLRLITENQDKVEK